MRKLIQTALVVFAVSAAGTGVAAQMPNMPGMAQAADAKGVGVIKSIDQKAGTVTIAHEPIKELNWPAMTMPFKVAQPALLENKAAGNKVEFALRGKDMSATIISLTVVP